MQCNQTVKFKDLFDVAKDLKADALITGHYVKNITINEKVTVNFENVGKKVINVKNIELEKLE